MPQFRAVLAIFVILVVTACDSLLRAAELLRPRNLDAAAYAARLRSGKTEVRLAAVQELALRREPQAAGLLIESGLSDADEGVRYAAYRGLRQFKDPHASCNLVITQLNAQNRGERHDSTAPLLLAILLGCELPDIRTATDRYLNKTLVNSRDGQAFACAMVDLLASHPEPDNVLPLKRLAWSAMADKLPVRRAVVYSLTKIDDSAALEALVQLTAKYDAEVLAEIYEYLNLVTGEHCTESAAWSGWWNANKATFQFPKELKGRDARQFDEQVSTRLPRFYGLPLYSRRIVFVIDTSSSMLAPASGKVRQRGIDSGVSRFEAAKRELVAALQALDRQSSFAIVAFSDQATCWKPELMPATSENIADALQFLEKPKLRHTTSTYNALRAASRYDAEAIYLLTDGAPTSGTEVDPKEIVRWITRLIHEEGRSIYTIGIGIGAPGSRFEVFLRSLAEKNYGVFRRVNE